MILNNCIIKNLPDGTFFHVNNGAWDGYVTTENGEKICYAGVEKRIQQQTMLIVLK